MATKALSKPPHQHTLAYGILIIGLADLTFLFMSFWPERNYQRATIVAMVLFYITWGTVTHFKTKHLTLEVWLEYVGVGCLGGALLFLVTL